MHLSTRFPTPIHQLKQCTSIPHRLVYVALERDIWKNLVGRPLPCSGIVKARKYIKVMNRLDQLHWCAAPGFKFASYNRWYVRAKTEYTKYSTYLHYNYITKRNYRIHVYLYQGKCSSRRFYLS